MTTKRITVSRAANWGRSLAIRLVVALLVLKEQGLKHQRD